MASFTDLNLSKPLMKAIAGMALDAPTPIQEKAYPVIMSGRDAVGIAQTGTGKTIAYLLPILRWISYSEQRQPRVLILVPTRELVVQVVKVITELTRYMSVRTFGVYGASNINTQKQKVFDGLDILVATPGRLIDLTLSRTLQLGSVKKLVIDEVDEMLNLGFRPQLLQVLEALPLKRQNLLFSATLNEELESMITKYFTEPVYIELISRGTPLTQIIQQGFEVPNFNTKVSLLNWLLVHEKNFTKVLLFVKNKKVADDLESRLDGSAGDIAVIHSNKSQPNRFSAVHAFQHGQCRLLIATDVVARGVDISDVTHVVNFDVPSDAGVYIHRIGRTGRAGRAGSSITFITPGDAEYIRAIEVLMNKKIPLLPVPGDIEISDELTADEMPVKRDKNLKKLKKVIVTGGAFHEKKAKNRKVQLGGKRRQEKQRRALLKSRSKRK